MIKSLPISEARREINNIAASLDREDTISVTSRGKEVLAILPWDSYEAIVETLDIMSDPELMNSLKQSIAEYKSGKAEDWDEVKKELELA
jgi:prevent-host-death family protein